MDEFFRNCEGFANWQANIVSFVVALRTPALPCSGSVFFPPHLEKRNFVSKRHFTVQSVPARTRLTSASV